jgi:hypothetical protein
LQHDGLHFSVSVQEDGSHADDCFDSCFGSGAVIPAHAATPIDITVADNIIIFFIVICFKIKIKTELNYLYI